MKRKCQNELQFSGQKQRNGNKQNPGNLGHCRWIWIIPVAVNNNASLLINQSFVSSSDPQYHHLSSSFFPSQSIHTVVSIVTHRPMQQLEYKLDSSSGLLHWQKKIHRRINPHARADRMFTPSSICISTTTGTFLNILTSDRDIIMFLISTSNGPYILYSFLSFPDSDKSSSLWSN